MKIYTVAIDNGNLTLKHYYKRGDAVLKFSNIVDSFMSLADLETYLHEIENDNTTCFTTPIGLKVWCIIENIS